ncbi:MAG: DUF3830 family protein [Gammaproteobacteria bacterium]
MNQIKIEAGPYSFRAQLEDALAPKTCALFRGMLPYREKLIHARWSGEGCWVPLGNLSTGLPFENATSYPAPGQIIFYPGGYSETEILIPYGGLRFASKLGQLAANHFLTITAGLEQLPALGQLVLSRGAQDVRFELC